jgi:DNA ligase (NAD+)
VDELARLCETLNLAYRDGNALVTDRQYDELFVGPLRQRAPDHPFVNQVEPEGDALGKAQFRHERPLLSTAKAYGEDEIAAFFRRVSRVAADLGYSSQELRYRVLAKLDGIAGVSDGRRLLSRGNGYIGADLSHGLARGLVMVGDGLGLGEIVLDQGYFESVLQPQFNLSHQRNYIAGFFSADTVKAHHESAAAAGAIRFVPYTTLPCWRGSADELLANWRSIMSDIRSECPYLTDGVVLELDGHEDVREALGATSHHYRYQLAIKSQGETAIGLVASVRFQVGRTGRVTPVIELDEAVVLEGAAIMNITAHTAQTIERLGIGPGATVIIERAGAVVPKLRSVATPADQVSTVDACPSCGTTLESEGEYAICPNTIGCPAQAETRIQHWFSTLGTADLFGPATVSRLVEAGYRDVGSVYSLGVDDFRGLGFGPGQSGNLRRELDRSLSEPIPDWRWLAAAGIRHLGRGDSRRLLAA